MNAAGWETLREWFIDRLTLSAVPEIYYLVLLTAVILSLFMIRLSVRRHRMRTARDRLALTIGGWGTRGKSGTERKKAALFHGLGFNVVSKTTGCEAMIIHSAPGLEPVEIPIYRPGNKASIWEQEKVVGYGAKLDAEIFLWECMALGPDYASIMQHDWMQDDFATMSNTFVDHENVQGPSGLDVSNSLAAFIPESATFFTAEESMLPVLRQAARKHGAKLVDLKWYESDLIPEEVLSLFPYRAHPRNLGLTLKLAEHLQIPGMQAISLIADNIVPDMGAFKRYDAVFRNQRLEFWNGMSANDRTSCLYNWTTAGFAEHTGDTDTWIVTVINNRDDRIPRSREFAEIIVSDTPAHLHVVIGTNTSGFVGYVKESLHRFAGENCPLAEDRMHNRSEAALDQIRRKTEKILERFRCNVYNREQLRDEIRKMMSMCSGDGALDERLTSYPALENMSLEAIKAMLPAAICMDDLTAEKIARRIHEDCAIIRALESFLADMTRLLQAEPPVKKLRKRAEKLFYGFLVKIFDRKLFVIKSPFVTGDQILDRIHRHVPPGYTIKIMGMQNIKGTGLDFAYRWMSLAKVQEAVENLFHADHRMQLHAVNFLASYQDYGVLDAPIALDALKKLKDTPMENALVTPALIEQTIRQILAKYRKRQALLKTTIANTPRRVMLRILEQILEPGDSKRRKKQVNRIMDDLIHHRITHLKAAELLHALNTRQDGGWLVNKFGAGSERHCAYN